MESEEEPEAPAVEEQKTTVEEQKPTQPEQKPTQPEQKPADAPVAPPVQQPEQKPNQQPADAPVAPPQTPTNPQPQTPSDGRFNSKEDVESLGSVDKVIGYNEEVGGWEVITDTGKHEIQFPDGTAMSEEFLEILFPDAK